MVWKLRWSDETLIPVESKLDSLVGFTNYSALIFSISCHFYRKVIEQLVKMWYN